MEDRNLQDIKSQPVCEIIISNTELPLHTTYRKMGKKKAPTRYWKQS